MNPNKTKKCLIIFQHICVYYDIHRKKLTYVYTKIISFVHPTALLHNKSSKYFRRLI